MDPLHIFVLEHSFSSLRPFESTSKNIVDSLLKLNFDGDGNVSTLDQLYSFICKCKHFKIFAKNEVCMLLTLTFEGRI